MAVRVRPDNLSLVDPAVQAGVDAARIDFEELWEHRESLRAICLRMADDPTTADDVVQETFVRALSHAETLDRRESFAPWLATVARRRSIDEIRLRRRVRPVSTTPEMEVGAAEDPAEQVLKQEMVRRLRTALGELSTRERQLLLRQVTHGLTLAELAEEEDTSIASVRSVLNRARTKLRGSLERGGPLGAAPLPRLIAAIKRRLHGVAARLEGHAPLLGGAGAHFGDVVAAVIAAVALLAAGTTPNAGTSLVTMPVAASAASATQTPAPVVIPANSRLSAEATSANNTSARGDEPPIDIPAPSPLSDADGVWDALSTLPGDQADQPEKSTVTSLSASSDGSVVFATAITDQGGSALYKSIDEGRSWARVGGTYTGNTVLFSPTYPRSRALFTIDSNKLQRSTDDGLSWEFMAATPLAGSTAFAPDYQHDPRLVIANNATLWAYNTADGSSSPLPIVPPDRSLGDIVLSPDFVATGRMLVSATSVHGTRPNAPSVFECTYQNCVRRAVFPNEAFGARLLDSKSTGLVLAGVNTTLQLSADGGRTFSSMSVPPKFHISSLVDGAPGEVLVGGAGTDGQASFFRWAPTTGTWTPLGRGTALELGTSVIVRLPSGRIITAPGGSSGVLCSADNGATWAPRCSA